MEKMYMYRYRLEGEPWSVLSWTTFPVTKDEALKKEIHHGFDYEFFEITPVKRVEKVVVEFE